MAETKRKTVVTGDFIWPAPDINRLRSAVEGPIRSFVPEASLYAKTTSKGPWQSETTYNSIDDWLSGLTPDVTTTWGSISDSQLDRSIQFSWQPPESGLHISASTPEVETARAQIGALLEALVTTLDLKPKASMSAELLFTQVADGMDWFAAAHEIARHATGSTARFHGSWDEADIDRRETEIEAEWQKAVGKAKNWSAEWSGHGSRFTIRNRSRWNEISMQIDSYDEAPISFLLSEIMAIPGLKPKLRDPQLQGESRRYFLSQEATSEWYETALKLVRGFASRDASFWGRVTRDGEMLSERAYGNVETWWQAMEEALDAGDIATSHVSYRGQEAVITFELDHYRDALWIDVQSAAGEGVQQMHEKLATALSLSRAPQDAYRYRRWGRTYDVRWVDSATFAGRLEFGLKALFAGRRVALTQATLHLGAGDEQVLSSRNLTTFLAQLKNAQDLSQIHLVAQAPRGEFMGIHLDKELRRMELLANTEYDRFEAFASELKKALRRVKVRENNDADTEGRGTKEKSVWAVPLLVAAIGLAGSLMGSQLLTAMREPPELVIDLPPSKDGLSEVQSSDVILAWTYKKPHAVLPPTVDNQREAIVDVRLSDGTVIIPNEVKRGSVQLKGLVEGSYSVRITADGASKSLLLQVKAKPAPPSPPEPRK